MARSILRSSAAWFATFAGALLVGTAATASPRPCISPDQAAHFLNKDICITAHIYDVVELPDGTRFLDVCSPQTPDLDCLFTIESLREDREDVGELRRLRGTDVHIRGLLQRMHGRTGMLLSHERQFHGGPPKFRPNPLLAHGFSAEQRDTPLRDPNLSSQGGRRAFMNSRDVEPSPPK